MQTATLHLVQIAQLQSPGYEIAGSGVRLCVCLFEFGIQLAQFGFGHHNSTANLYLPVEWLAHGNRRRHGAGCLHLRQNTLASRAIAAGESLDQRPLVVNQRMLTPSNFAR